jgi:nitrogen fixation/metabolism regulation signal transduction histidine kinase
MTSVVMPNLAPREAPRRPTHRFRRKLLLVLVGAGLLPLLAWAWVGDSLLEGALAVAPPVGELLGQAAAALDRPSPNPADDARLAADLRAAELHLVQADLARRRLLEQAPLSFLLALFASAGLVALSAWVLGRRLSRPIEALAAGMARIGRGDLAHQVPTTGRGDELDYLAVELNRMGAELLRQRERLHITEALAAWRDAARALAHDLKNPLTAMRMALGRLTRPGRSEEAFGEAAALLQEELDVLIRMSQTFSEFARLPAPEPRPLELGALLREVAGLYAAEADVVLRLPDAGGTVHADADQLRRALGNLIKNAVEASAGVTGAAPVEIGLFTSQAWVHVEVRDHGVGVSKAIEGPELMAGLRSGKREGGERGLGLPIAHKIIHEHGGRLRLSPAQPGTVAAVELPLVVGTT